MNLSIIAQIDAVRHTVAHLAAYDPHIYNTCTMIKEIHPGLNPTEAYRRFLQNEIIDRIPQLEYTIQSSYGEFPSEPSDYNAFSREFLTTPVTGKRKELLAKFVDLVLARYRNEHEQNETSLISYAHSIRDFLEFRKEQATRAALTPFRDIIIRTPLADIAGLTLMETSDTLRYFYESWLPLERHSSRS